MIKSRRGTDRISFESGRLGRGVGIKRRAFDLASSGPESGAAGFVRIGLARDRVGPLRRRSAGEPSDRQIEAAPEEMHRAALADEARTKILQNRAGRNENAPEAMRILGIVRFMHFVLRERNRVSDLVRAGMNLYLDTERIELSHQLAIKLGHAPRRQIHSLYGAFAGFDDQLTRDEIEPDFENPAPVGNG